MQSECYFSVTREGLSEMVTHTLRPNDMEMPSRGNTGSAKAWWEKGAGLSEEGWWQWEVSYVCGVSRGRAMQGLEEGEMA